MEKQIEELIAKMFKKHKTKVGSYQCWEWAISESDIEDFVFDILKELKDER